MISYFIYFRRGGRGRPAGGRFSFVSFRACAGLAGEARTGPDYNQNISQAGRGQPARYPLLFCICGEMVSSGVI